MKNPILVPELRDVLSSNNVEAVKDFCASVHPATVAEFLSALEPEEIRQVLFLLDAELSAEIFKHLDEDIQSAVIEPLRRDELARLVSHFDAKGPAVRLAFSCSRLPPNYKLYCQPRLSLLHENCRNASKWP